MKISIIKVKHKYKMRTYPSLNLPGLQTVKVTGIYTLGDGTKIIEFKHNFPFIIKEYMELEEFKKNIAIHSEDS